MVSSPIFQQALHLGCTERVELKNRLIVRRESVQTFMRLFRCLRRNRTTRHREAYAGYVSENWLQSPIFPERITSRSPIATRMRATWTNSRFV
jgi:hypothetical protein